MEVALNFCFFAWNTRLCLKREGEAPAEPRMTAKHRLSRSFALPISRQGDGFQTKSKPTSRGLCLLDVVHGNWRAIHARIVDLSPIGGDAEFALFFEFALGLDAEGGVW